jgi:hypothetical protein
VTSPFKTILQVTIDFETALRLRKIATDQKMTVNDIVRAILAKAVEDVEVPK